MQKIMEITSGTSSKSTILQTSSLVKDLGEEERKKILAELPGTSIPAEEMVALKAHAGISMNTLKYIHR